ncbi:MAG: Stk1 family PASTA domain-containing Ser/Thr kinase [Bacillota bacterium]|nr:Stk1 family PASTA domain-containing Ser/Thr kinase [Bacillota bacterium]
MASRILAGRYELLEKIGEGGMAVVFKSRDRLLNRYVAIKILRPEFTKDAVFIESFRRESQMAAGLSHPNIVNIYDVGKEGNIYYIVMELMEGEPLSDIIKREGALEPQKAASITRQIASALAAAHKNNLIHRDVKPHNIMFSADGSAKITDFGIAKKVTGETLVGEQKENVMGSVHYFSPEQARGGYVDAKSDIYSLGICLYEMLTGKVPFDGETAVEVAVKHMNEKMIPPTQLNPNIPKDLEDIVLKATDKIQTNRYKSMDEMITALNFVSYNKHHVEEAPYETKREECIRNEAKAKSIAISDDFLFGKEAKIEEPEEVATVSEKAVKEKPVSEKTEVALPKETVKKKFLLKPQRYIAVILAIILALPVSAGIFKLTTIEKAPKTVEINVPSIVGMTVEEAEKELAKSNLKLEVELELVSDDVPEGQIMSQTPQENSTVKSNQTIRVNVSKGSVTPYVPNVAGKSISNARTVVESYGYRLVISGYAKNDKIDKDYVISQNPATGTELEKGSTVSVVLSSGKEEVPEIDIVGLPYAEALQTLEEAGYSLGARINQSSTEIPDGCIIKYVIDGKKVDLYVSAGRSGGNTNPDAEPTGSISYTFSFDGIELPETTSAFQAKITIVDDNGSRTVTEDCTYEEGQKTLTIYGSGVDCEITIMVNNQLIEQLHHVNFTTGEHL